jgi:hypothetical protein
MYTRRWPVKVVNALRNKRPGSVGGIQSTELTFEDGRVETYSLIRGSIVWPHETYPGVILLGAQKLDSDKVEILEEMLFSDMSGAVEVLQELWSYMPSCYYYREDPEGEAFVSFLLRSPELTGKLPLVAAPHPKALEYGVQLIGKFLEENRSEIPAGSTLATQLKEARQDTPTEEVFAITALRYLLAGIKEVPWEKEIEDFNLESCLA